MIVEIKKTEKGYLAHYERQLGHSKESVWAMLTDNNQLEKWFPELRVGELQNGGFMKFYIQDVMDEKLEITELEIISVLEFDWFGDKVRFELDSKEEGCLLIFKQEINTLTEHSKKNLAGWHVCLDVIKSLLDGETIERKKEWRKWYEKYARAIDELIASNNK